MRKIKRCAIVGLGSIGRRHLRIIKQIRPEVDVVLVRTGKGGFWEEESLAEYSVTSIREAINHGIDAAIVASPAPLHAEQAEEFVTNNVPVLVEKPLAHEKDSLNELLNMDERLKSKMLVGYTLRYSVAANFFDDFVKGGRIGQPLFAQIDCGSYLPDWRPDQDYRETASAKKKLGGGALLELSHEIDYANWFFGPFNSVIANVEYSGSLDIEVEDSADLILKSKKGFQVSVHVDFCRRPPTRTCRIHGSEGTLIWDAIANRVTWIPGKGEAEYWDFDDERDDMFRSQLNHFFGCVENSVLPRVRLEDGATVLHLIDAAWRSSRESRTVVL